MATEENAILCSLPGCGKQASGKSQCPKCKSLGIKEGSMFCSQECFSKFWPQHKVAHYYTRGRTSMPYDVDSLLLPGAHSFSFYTPSAQSLKLQTKRLTLRCITESDFVRIHALKSEPAVTATQLYPTQTSLSHTIMYFSWGYIQGCIPHVTQPWQRLRTGTTRKKFNFAIEPSVNPDTGSRMVEPRDPGPKVTLKQGMMDADGYIGHVSFDFERAINGSLNDSHDPGAVSDPSKGLEPLTIKKGVAFRWPSRASLKDITVRLYYEIHPCFWSQGVMTEAVEAILTFCLKELGVSSVWIDPMEHNTGSLKVAEKLGLKKMAEVKIPNEMFTGRRDLKGKKKVLWVMREEDWKGESEFGEACERLVCRYCMNPRAEGIMKCKHGCEWALYCSEECRLAHWKLQGGHQEECEHSP